MLSDLGVEKSCLMALPGRDDLVLRASRNIKRLSGTNVGSINVYDVLRADKLLLTQDAARAIEEVYAS